jgi:hypothetical protein
MFIMFQCQKNRKKKKMVVITMLLFTPVDDSIEKEITTTIEV